jgi:molybdopterin-containing oxidoreductase family iron-sulfur binding subunit
MTETTQNKPSYWRSLEELVGSERVRQLIEREFPEGASELDPMGRRQFLKLMGASLALAGLTACTRQPTERIVPYVRPPEQVIPGKPLFFATAMSLGSSSIGLLAESHEGRPTKIEGNPDHPASLGATDVFAQASILGLYDPDRSQTVTYLGEVSTWSAFLGAIGGALQAQAARRGAGLRILTETVISPTLAHQLKELLSKFPEARWHQYEPISRSNVLAGAGLAFGRPLNVVYRIERADRIVSLDADLFSELPGGVRYAREFARRRRGDRMNRLYVIESAPTVTGAKADHRLALGAGQIEGFARALAARLGALPQSESWPAPHQDWIEAVAKDLESHRGSSVVIAGQNQPPSVHAIVHAINQVLGAPGQTLFYTDPIEADPSDQLESLGELVRAIEAGRVDVLIIIGGNPAYNAPADFNFAELMAKVVLSVRLGLYYDETSEYSRWHIPEAHYLEAWSDVRSYDGTASIVQPLILPLYGGKSAHELLSALLGQPERSGYDIVRSYWEGWYGRDGFEQFWRKALHDGFVPNTAFQPKSASLAPGWWEKLGKPQSPSGIEINFRPDPSVYDGRFANNGWLQELPRPLTKLTWDNAAMVSPKMAERLGLVNGEMVELELGGRRLRAPAWILPGQPDQCVTLHLGYGRTRAGGVGTGVGFNAYLLRASNSMWFSSGLQVSKVGQRHNLVSTQHHHLVEGRDIIRSGTLEEYRKDPSLRPEGARQTKRLSLYPEHEYKGYAWGMAIDLSACIGCNACVIACQSENNIPVVGKEQVDIGREMHWIRVDRYYEGKLSDPKVHFQPVLCMQCENAPCEVVCPVAATVHSAEGLNDMVYNRCVGTRYCSNNCPYKVRRFNFLLYQDWEAPSLKLMRNPDVTVRSRGVMEKCTYCVQRINRARIEAELEGRQIRDLEILTACQQVCPAEAIVFGNINDPSSRVSRLKSEARNYALLEELNTRPRTTYLAELRNPNPELLGDQ